jgi:hypothetical protein
VADAVAGLDRFAGQLASPGHVLNSLFLAGFAVFLAGFAVWRRSKDTRRQKGRIPIVRPPGSVKCNRLPEPRPAEGDAATNLPYQSGIVN